MHRALKPFIRRDYESRPLKLRLLQEIVAYPHRCMCVFYWCLSVFVTLQPRGMKNYHVQQQCYLFIF